MMKKVTSIRKEREKEARRAAILIAAARVFSNKGYRGSTLEEIAIESELSKGTIYNYYRDKEDLFVSLVRQGYGQFQETLDRIVAEGGSLNGFLQRLFKFSLQTMQDHKYLIRLMITEGAHLSENLQEDIAAFCRSHTVNVANSLARALQSIPQTKGLTDDDRLTGAGLILASIRYIYVTNTINTNTNIPDKEIENFIRLLSRALSMEPIT